jgi:hypothetical protein
VPISCGVLRHPIVPGPHVNEGGGRVCCFASFASCACVTSTFSGSGVGLLSALALEGLRQRREGVRAVAPLRRLVGVDTAESHLQHTHARTHAR